MVQYAKRLYNDQTGDGETGDPEEDDPSDEVDIEKEVSQEVTGIKQARKDALFVPVKVDIQCGMNTITLYGAVIDFRKFCLLRPGSRLSPCLSFTKSARTP